jgi:hypothetical protein
VAADADGEGGVKRIPLPMFLAAYRRVQRAGGTYADFSKMLGQSINTLAQRTYQTRLAGTPLPALRSRQQRSAERLAFDDVVLEHIGYFAKPFAAIFAEVVEHWGTVSGRTLHRSLRRHRDGGAIELGVNGYVRARAARRAA